MFGVQPAGILDSTFEIDWFGTDSGLGPTEQLYTAKGSQDVGVNKPVIENTFLDTSDYKSTVILKA